jgi:carboxyl-terminal processing protease
MPSERRSSRGPLLAGMALALLLGFGLARGLQATDDVYSQLDFFNQIFNVVQRAYVDVPDNDKLVKGAIDGMLRTLDPHTVYLPAERAEKMDEDFHGEYTGIGINFEIRDGVIVVIAPLEGTPAYRLGIRAGDHIVEIDHKPVPKTVTNDDVFKQLRGKAGSLVDVAIAREGENEPLNYTIERAKIPIESIPYAYMIRPGVGYVRVIRFAQTTGDELEKAIEKLHEQGMKELLIDLRYNAGGLLNQAVDVLDQLVPANKLLVYTRGRIPQANADYRSSDRPRVAEHVPVVVLIDHGSASASEIVSGALQDLDRGIVAGTNSFGKGLVQNQISLGQPAGSKGKLLLTIAKYYTPSGRLIQRDYTKFANRDDYTEEGIAAGDVPSDSALATRPKFKTTGGRLVYGGGGIYPDVVIKDPPLLTKPQVDMLAKRVFFEYATHYVNQHKDVQWSHEMLGRNFNLTDADWSDLRKLMDKQKVTSVTDSVWTADRPFMLRQVRAEIGSATLGSLERYRIAVEDDPQLNSALELFPRASQLMAGMMDASGKAPKSAKTPNPLGKQGARR